MRLKDGRRSDYTGDCDALAKKVKIKHSRTL